MDRDGPVSPRTAKMFVEALQAEYVQGAQGAVGEVIDRADPGAAQMMNAEEDAIRNLRSCSFEAAQDALFVLNTLAERLGGYDSDGSRPPCGWDDKGKFKGDKDQFRGYSDYVEYDGYRYWDDKGKFKGYDDYSGKGYDPNYDRSYDGYSDDKGKFKGDDGYVGRSYDDYSDDKGKSKGYYGYNARGYHSYLDDKGKSKGCDGYNDRSYNSYPDDKGKSKGW